MAISDDDRREKNLKRYFDNQVKYNERQKKYFNEVWYPKNKKKISEYQKIYRELNRTKPPRQAKQQKIQKIKTINTSCVVSFD